MDKLKELLSMCKCSVQIEVNSHRDYYDTIDKAIADIEKEGGPARGTQEKLSDEVKAGMKRTETIIYLHYYPRTPIGFHSFYHYDIDLALQEAIDSIKEHWPNP